MILGVLSYYFFMIKSLLLGVVRQWVQQFMFFDAGALARTDVR